MKRKKQEYVSPSVETKENKKQYQAPVTEAAVCHVECGFSLSGITEPERPRNTEAMEYGTPMSI